MPWLRPASRPPFPPRTLLPAAGLLAFTTALGAQTLPVPDLPEAEAVAPVEVPPSSAAGEPAPAGVAAITALEPARRGPWEIALSAGVGWDDNIDFQSVDPLADVLLVPRADVARVFRHRRGELRAAATGWWNGYREEEDLRRGYADVGLSGTWRSSARTTWDIAARYDLGDTASSQILREQGVALPRVKTRSVEGLVGVSVRGRGGALHVEGRVHGTDFDSAELVDGASARATIELQRYVGPRGTLGVGYALEEVLSDGPDGSYLTHFASVQVSRTLSRRTAVLLEGGASATPDAERAGLEHRQSFFGGASFSGRRGDASVLVFVRREVAPAFGTGTSRLDLRTGARAEIGGGGPWHLFLEASHVRPDSAAGREPAGASYDGSASLGRTLGRGLELRGEASYRRIADALPELQQLQAVIFVSFFTGRERVGRLLR